MKEINQIFESDFDLSKFSNKRLQIKNRGKNMINLTILENSKVYTPSIQIKFENLVIQAIQDNKKRIDPFLKTERSVDLKRDCDRAFIRVIAKRKLRKEGLINN